MDLTVGPNFFFWDAAAVRAFYAALAAAPVARVVLGEPVCSKRLPFWQDEIPAAVERLRSAGKAVALTSLALITLKRERRLTADLAGTGLPVEVNDLTALAHIPPAALRLSPQSRDFVAVCRGYADRIAGRRTAGALAADLAGIVPGGRLSDGFLGGPSGAHWSGAQ